MSPQERHPVEGQLLTACGIREDEQLRRLGIFLIAHTVMDTHLISVLLDHEIGKVGGIGLLSHERLQLLSDDLSHHTFKKHFDQARAHGLISDRAAQIAEEVNRGRDSFVHFKRYRFELPCYDGQPVVEEEGFRVCMDAIQEFLLLIPFRYIGWTANP